MAVTTAGRSSTTRLVHMFEAFRELAGGHDIIRAFDDMGAALEWLEVQP